MPMRIIRGAIGSGKTDLCMREIERTHAENPEAKCIMIVPNHYSYETERRFVERFGGTGLNNIEVLTLRKMAINFLSAAELKYLTPAGKQMLIYKAVNDYCPDTEITDARLIASVKKPGFLDVAASLISEMKRYSVSPAALTECAEKISENDTLKNKVAAFGEIYGRYNGFVEGSGYTDSEDDVKRLAEFISGSDRFDGGTYVWFGKFDEFMPYQLRVIEAFLKRGAHVTVCANCPENDSGIYEQLRDNLYNLEDLALLYGGEGSLSLTESLSHMDGNKELKFLFETWGDRHAVYDGVPESISLFESRDSYGEVEYIAGKIVDCVREDRLRFRNIAVLCGDAEEYRHIVRTVFEEYEIPYFTDSTMPLSDHPIAMQILSLFDIFEDDWSYEAVFAYLRAGFIYENRGGRFEPIDRDKTDLLENFVLRCGIRGQSRWLGEEKWDRSPDIISTAFGEETAPAPCSPLDDFRRSITAPIVEFKKATERRKTAKEHAKALFDYFESINLYFGLHGEITKLREEGRLDEAEQFTSIWNLLLEVLNQTVVTVGEEKMNRAQFGEYIRAGLTKCEIRTIPSGIDQVYVGTVERSSRSRVEVMFVAGAVGGTFPNEPASEGFLSNNDRSVLGEKYNITLAPDTKKKSEKQYFKVYRALSAVCGRLFLSYPLQNSEGRALRPSDMITEIHRKFPKLKIYDNLSDADEKIYISSPKATIHKMLINKSGRKNAGPVWEAVYEWYKKSGEWDSMLGMLENAEKFSARDIKIDASAAVKLYENKGPYSASRLNTYAKCPFSYFIKYGIGAYERQEWEITPADAGSYAHAVIKEFCERVEDGADSASEKLEKWRALRGENEEGAEPSREEILDEIISSTRENMLASQTRDKERTAAIFGRMGKNIRHAAKIVHMSLKNGLYAEDGMERRFELDLGGGVAVKGIIDRVDALNKAEETHVRIIDYKTGSTAFDVVDIYNRVDMQPVIYAVAARELAREDFGKAAAVTGIYYNKVRDDFEKLKYGDDAAKAEEKHGRARRLDGVTFVDAEGDNSVIYDMDADLKNGGQSEFLNVSAGDDGSIVPSDSVHTRTEIEGLMETVTENIREMDREINEGNIALSPYASASSGACDYCEYRSVCSFDGGRRSARVREGTKTEIWEKMKEKGETAHGKLDKRSGAGD